MRSWRKANRLQIDDPELAMQVKVSKMLGIAFALSITGLAGAGSLIAVILGVRAIRIIKGSNGKLGGALMAWWCIAAGALGTLILPWLTIKLIIRELR